MKLLVFSDSHGSIEAMRRIALREAPDRIVHLGDYAADALALARELPGIPISFVPGNCDGPTRFAHTLVETYEGVTLFMTHGHRYGVKRDLLHLSLAAREAGAALALFGHTHVPLLEREGALVLLNPGVCQDRGAAPYAAVELTGGRILRCELRADGVTR